MSAFRIASSMTPRQIPKAKPKKDSDYLSFLHRLPCCVTGLYDVQAAHLSTAAPAYGHYGRGKGHKASDRWALPLCEKEHIRQHSGNEMEYWRLAGVNPHVLALSIWGLWTEYGDDAEEFATALINGRIWE
jgi:hypothetical protein